MEKHIPVLWDETIEGLNIHKMEFTSIVRWALAGIARAFWKNLRMAISTVSIRMRMR